MKIKTFTSIVFFSSLLIFTAGLHTEAKASSHFSLNLGGLFLGVNQGPPPPRYIVAPYPRERVVYVQPAPITRYEQVVVYPEYAPVYEEVIVQPRPIERRVVRRSVEPATRVRGEVRGEVRGDTRAIAREPRR